MPPEISVSRETEEKLQIYKALLQKWQAKINLIATSTLSDADKRHFQDSLQLALFLSQNSKVYDLGSGAGFPGLVLAIVRPDLDITLIESDGKKVEFLRTVSRETKTGVKIHHGRVEASDLKAPDIVTCRAFASLEQILAWTKQWWLENPVSFILLKGENIDQESALALKKYRFDIKKTPSQTDDRGSIVEISNIKQTTS